MFGSSSIADDDISTIGTLLSSADKALPLEPLSNSGITSGRNQSVARGRGHYNNVVGEANARRNVLQFKCHCSIACLGDVSCGGQEEESGASRREIDLFFWI
jgi:hypothetical protein